MAEVNSPNQFRVYITKNKKMDLEINKFLNNIRRDVPLTFGSSILYIIGELTDNIEQHSNYSNAFVFFRHSPKEKQVEAAVFDDGFSIPVVFEKNKIRFSKDFEAIKMAIEGKTTKKEDISRGFGLRTIREIVKALKGRIQIISRKGMLDIQDSKIDVIDFEKDKLDGTFIYLKLKIPDKDLNIYSYLE